ALSKETEYYLGIYDVENKLDESMLMVNKILSGDPVRGNMAIDTTKNLKNGQFIKFMYRKDYSKFESIPKVSNNNSINLVLATSDKEEMDFSASSPTLNTIFTEKNIFGGISENGIIVGKGAISENQIGTSWQTLTNPRISSSLPLSRLQSHSPIFHISNNPFNIRFSTNILNNVFGSIVKRLPKFWKIWFTIGVVVGIITFLFGIGTMIVASWKLLIAIFDLLGSSWSAETEIVSPDIVKRSFEDNNVQHDINEKDHQVFIPVAGHALAAAKERIEIKSTGIFLYILYPGAFVEFDLHELKDLSALKQLRIICAGVWHNAVLFLLGTLLLNTGILTMFMGNTAWRLVDGLGVSVVSVESDTALSTYLKPSMLITKLDDFDLSGSSLDSWNDYLLQNEKLYIDSLGFCASKKDSASLDCCDISIDHPYGNAKDNMTSCFKRIDENNEHKQELACLPTIPILLNIDAKRCLNDADCSSASSMCVLPYMPKGYPKPLRIYFKDAPWVQENDDQEKLVLYIGELVDVWEIVQVSILQPRWSWVPIWIPISIELTLRYTISFSLALGVLNILPAFKLDGHYALNALLLWISGVDYDLDDSVYTSNIKHRRKRFGKGVVFLVTGLVGWVVVGTLFFSLFSNYSKPL
ncbi:14225_t:CDS:10, partial [Dentiscutata heterogama]